MQNHLKRLSKVSSRAFSALLCLTVSVSGWPTGAMAADDFDLESPAAPPTAAVMLNTSCMTQNQQAASVTSWQDLLGQTVFSKDKKTGGLTTTETTDEFFYDRPPEGLGLEKNISINSQCPAATGGREDLPEECSALAKIKEEDFIKAQMAAMAGYACHIKQADAIQGELGCLKGAIQSVEQSINQMKSQFTPVITQATKDLQTADTMIKDRETQQTKLVEALQGNQATGKKGLLAIKQELEGLSKALPSIAVTARQQVEKLQNTKDRVEVLIKQNKMSLAMDCFSKKPMANYRCTKNGPIVSAKEYLLCRYEQSQYVAKGGKVVVNKANQKNAASRKESLGKLLDQIAGEAPTLTSLPAASDVQGFESSIKTYSINTPNDVKTRYSSYLKNMEGSGGMPIDSFVQSALNNCYKEASRTVDNQRTDPNSQITQIQKGIKSQEEQMQATMKGQIIEYAAKYTEAIKGNTGLELPMSTNACLQGTPADQASCIQALSNSLNTILTGNVTETEKTKLTSAAMALTGGKAPVFAFNQQFNASTPALAFKLECRGVNGCVAAMQAKETEIQSLIQDTKAKKEAYATNVNSMVQKQAQSIGQAFSNVSGELRRRMDALAKAFVGAKAGGALNLEDRKVDPKSLQPNEKTGIYDLADIDQLIFANTAPALLTLDSKGFAEAEKALAESKEEKLEKFGKLRMAYNEFAQNKAACSKDSGDKKMQQIIDFNKESCATLAQTCKSDDVLTSLAKTGVLTNKIVQEDESPSNSTNRKLAQTGEKGKKSQTQMYADASDETVAATGGLTSGTKSCAQMVKECNDSVAMDMAKMLGIDPSKLKVGGSTSGTLGQ